MEAVTAAGEVVWRVAEAAGTVGTTRMLGVQSHHGGT